MKTFRFTLLTIATLLCSISASAHDFEVDGIYYNVTSSEYLTVEVTYSGSSSNEEDEYIGEIVIPERVTYNSNTYSVTSIGNSAFRECSSLTSITLPNSVTSIGNYAFWGCYGLTSITIPNTVTSIGEYAFRECSGLTSITLPNTVTSIGNYAFYDCEGLASITLPNTVTSIGNYAFYGCKGLTSITLPNTVTSIGNYAFYDCEGLASITLPNTVTSIGISAFDGCKGLTSITLPNSVTSIGEYAFFGCSGLASITIPNSVTSIGNRAFSGCSGLTSITIPNSVTSIGNYAFSHCTGLTSITLPNSVTSIGNYAFGECKGLTSVHITDLAAWCSIEFADVYSNPFCYAKHLYLHGEEIKDLVIPNSVTSIGNYAFSGCYGLTSITIPNSVTSIGNRAFSDCSGLTSITIPNSVTSIGEYAFYCCTGLMSVTIPNSVTLIKEGTFQNCSALTSITIPSSVTVIYGDAFLGCIRLTSVCIPGSVTSIGSKAFSGCSEVIEIICNATTPPLCGAKAFDGINKETCMLRVFKGCTETYKAADQWKDFLVIEEIADKYLLTWIVDNEVYRADSIAYEAAVDTIGYPTKEGYTFSGWNGIPVTMPARDVTVEGTFTPNTYTVTYKVDGEEYAKEEVAFGTAITQKEAPIKEGHTFSGWSGMPETMPANDITVEATFTPNTYTVTYKVDGEEYAKEEVTFGTTITQKEAPTKEGHTFSGWSEVPATMPAQDVTVEGAFTVNTYKLTYMVDGMVYMSSYVAYGSAIYPMAEPTKEGFIFSGWSEIPETMPAYDVEVTGEFASGISTITVENESPIYNLQGIEMEDKENLPASIYIQGGKKIVVK